jgi:hypothetical protein
VRLGIVVVYLVEPENGELLDLHLRKVRSMTRVPYKLYAGIKQLAPPLLQRLEREPCLEILPLPETDLRTCAEHSFYLERLIPRAIADGVTHIAIMHSDSFPVRPDWVETIAAQLTESRVLATISRDGFLDQPSACLFFRADFWAESQPRLRLTNVDCSSPEYACFSRAHPHYAQDSGIGYVFRAYTAGKTFLALEGPSVSESRGRFGAVYGDLVFHLAAAYRYGKPKEEERSAATRTLLGALVGAKKQLKRYFPTAIRRRTRRLS